MNLEWQGKTYNLDTDTATVKQIEKIHAYTGLSIVKWIGAVQDPDHDKWEKAIIAAYWLMLDQSGEHVPIADVDFQLLPFALAFMEALKAESDAEAAEKADPAEDPTVPPEAASAPSQARSRANGGQAHTRTGAPPDG